MTREAFVDLLDCSLRPKRSRKRSGSNSKQPKPLSRKTFRTSSSFDSPRAPKRATGSALLDYGHEDLSANDEFPLTGSKLPSTLVICGGTWAKMEERWFQIGNSIPVAEGDLTLRVAQILVPRLQSLGAQVTLVRSAPGPVTTVRPEELKMQAEASLRESGVTNILPSYAGPRRSKSRRFDPMGSPKIVLSRRRDPHPRRNHQ